MLNCRKADFKLPSFDTTLEGQGAPLPLPACCFTITFSNDETTIWIRLCLHCISERVLVVMFV